MTKYVPKEKMSKKAQKERNKAKRVTWGPLNPVTRKPQNPKAYQRKKVRREDIVFDAEPFFMDTYGVSGKQERKALGIKRTGISF